jgi:hypothetical protein
MAVCLGMRAVVCDVHRPCSSQRETPPPAAAWRPRFVVTAAWSDGYVPVRAAALGFEFSVPGVKLADGFHTPRLCDPAQVDFSSQPDCIMPGCNATRCEYAVALPGDPGTALDYSLQVRTMVHSMRGPEVFVPWRHRRCTTSQFAVLSGRDSVTCEPCPVGGDCRCVACTRGLMPVCLPLRVRYKATQAALAAVPFPLLCSAWPACALLPCWLRFGFGVICASWPNWAHAAP